MLVIGEKINIMSKTIGPAMKERDPGPVRDMALRQVEAGGKARQHDRRKPSPAHGIVRQRLLAETELLGRIPSRAERMNRLEVWPEGKDPDRLQPDLRQKLEIAFHHFGLPVGPHARARM
jgi:hypothetical protein